MTNQDVARLLRDIAAAYVIKDEKKHRFEIIAYQRAADAIEHSTTELQTMYSENKLEYIPGVGPSLKSYLEELFKTGNVKHFKEVIKDIPQAVFPLLNIPTFGPKKAYKIVSTFKLKNEKTVVEDVEKLAKNGRISDLPGFGEKSEQDILRAIKEFKLGKSKSSRMVLPYAFDLAQKVVAYLKESKDLIDVYPLGSLRRMVSTVGDIDIAVSSNNAQSVINHFVNYPNKSRIIEKGNTTASILLPGERQVDLMVQKPESFGSLLQHFTGSKHHNVALREHALNRGMSLSEYGIKIKSEKESKLKTFKNEEDFYKFIGLDFIPPELREDLGEIQLAEKHKLPKLVELKDIKADLHIHSNISIEPSHDSGVDSMEDMLKKAKSLGYEYLGFSEHNPSVSNHTEDQIYTILSRRKDLIDQINLSNKYVRVINLLEINILASGDLALTDKSLELIDGGIVSIHSAFSMDKEKMTERIINGLSHPKAKILGHPTGRLLNIRPGYEADWMRIYKFASNNNKALEINAWPSRLDLPDMYVLEAKKHGIKFVINTDSHALWQMNNMFYGVEVAKRGWLTKEDVLNTLPYQAFMSWLKG